MSETITITLGEATTEQLRRELDKAIEGERACREQNVYTGAWERRRERLEAALKNRTQQDRRVRIQRSWSFHAPWVELDAATPPPALSGQERCTVCDRLRKDCTDRQICGHDFGEGATDAQ